MNGTVLVVTFAYVCLFMHTNDCFIICDRILENSSKSHIKSSVFLHVFNLLLRMYLQSISYILSVI